MLIFIEILRSTRPLRNIYISNNYSKPFESTLISIHEFPFNSKHQSFCNDSADKSSAQSEESHQEHKPSKHARNTSTRSNSSSQSSGSSSRDVEVASQSSSPFARKPNENIPNSAAETANDDAPAHNETPYKVLAGERVSDSSAAHHDDPVMAALNDFKDLRIDEEYASSNSDNKSRSSKHDITLSGSGSPEHSKCLLLDSLKSYVNSAVSCIEICIETSYALLFGQRGCRS